MGSISERRTAIDRISNLPNSLITHILSFLSTEDAVRTSTLSTHWYEQWALMTNLDIDDGVLIEDNSEIKWNPTPRSEISFVNFVYRVLLYKATRLDLFSIKGGRDYGVRNVSQWLSIALSRDVLEIDLDLPLVDQCLAHGQLFSSRTLVFLTLGGGFLLKVPEIISLESLKVLQLNHVQFEDGESLSRLVSSCLVLEELKIKGNLSKTVNVLNISSPVLESLILIGLYSPRFSENRGAHSYEVVLNTPNLQYFAHIDKGVPDCYDIKSPLQCLDEAHLRLSMYGSQSDLDADQPLLVHRVAHIVVEISNVRFLYISEYAFEGFYRPDYSAPPDFPLPNFPRLTSLDIGAIGTDVGVWLLTTFLQNAPQLTSLSFALDSELELESWDPPTDVPSCLLHNLKVIEVVYCCKPELGFSMVKYFLENTNCLEELIIPLMKEENEEFINEISLLHRASKSCKIVFT